MAYITDAMREYKKKYARDAIDDKDKAVIEEIAEFDDALRYLSSCLNKTVESAVDEALEYFKDYVLFVSNDEKIANNDSNKETIRLELESIQECRKELNHDDYRISKESYSKFLDMLNLFEKKLMQLYSTVTNEPIDRNNVEYEIYLKMHKALMDDIWSVEFAFATVRGMSEEINYLFDNTYYDPVHLHNTLAEYLTHSFSTKQFRDKMKPFTYDEFLKYKHKK